AHHCGVIAERRLFDAHVAASVQKYLVPGDVSEHAGGADSKIRVTEIQVGCFHYADHGRSRQRRREGRWKVDERSHVVEIGRGMSEFGVELSSRLVGSG